MTVTETLSAFGAALRPDDLPDSVREDVRWRFVDTVGIALGGTRLDFAPSLLRSGERLCGPGKATVPGTPLCLSGVGAGFVTGSLAHGADFDDTHASAVVHPSSVVISTVIALGQVIGATGAACATAAVVGAEIGLRISLPFGQRLMARGFHPTSVCGPFAAAAAASHLLGLSSDEMTTALGLASSQAAGLLQGAWEGTWSKRLHPGWAAQAGIACAILAREGISGPIGALDGNAGVYRVYSDVADFIEPDAALEDLGTRWLYPESIYKPFPSAAWTHASLSALIEAMRSARLAADDVAEVICSLPPPAIPIVGDAARAWHPQTPYHMKNSLPYVLALQVITGSVTAEQFGPAALANNQISEFARRVRVIADVSLSTDDFPARVSIKTTDDRVIDIDVMAQRGSLANPMSVEEHRQKFSCNVAQLLSKPSTRQVLAGLEGVWSTADIRALIKATVPTQRDPE